MFIEFCSNQKVRYRENCLPLLVLIICLFTHSRGVTTGMMHFILCQPIIYKVMNLRLNVKASGSIICISLSMSRDSKRSIKTCGTKKRRNTEDTNYILTKNTNNLLSLTFAEFAIIPLKLSYILYHDKDIPEILRHPNHYFKPMNYNIFRVPNLQICLVTIKHTISQLLESQTLTEN